MHSGILLPHSLLYCDHNYLALCKLHSVSPSWRRLWGLWWWGMAVAWWRWESSMQSWNLPSSKSLWHGEFCQYTSYCNSICRLYMYIIMYFIHLMGCFWYFYVSVCFVCRFASSNTSIPIRLYLTNESGYYLDMSMYREVTDQNTGQVCVHLLPSSWC